MQVPQKDDTSAHLDVLACVANRRVCNSLSHHLVRSEEYSQARAEYSESSECRNEETLLHRSSASFGDCS